MLLCLVFDDSKSFFDSTDRYKTSRLHSQKPHQTSTNNYQNVPSQLPRPLTRHRPASSKSYTKPTPSSQSAILLHSQHSFHTWLPDLHLCQSDRSILQNLPLALRLTVWYRRLSHRYHPLLPPCLRWLWQPCLQLQLPSPLRCSHGSERWTKPSGDEICREDMGWEEGTMLER